MEKGDRSTDDEWEITDAPTDDERTITKTSTDEWDIIEPANTSTAPVETSAVETPSTVAGETTWTAERLATITPAEISELTPAQRMSAIAAADVHGPLLRAKAEALKIAGYKLAVMAEEAHATVLPLIRELVETEQHDEARVEINKLIDQGEANIRQVHRDDPATQSTVLERYRAVVQDRGLRTIPAAQLLPGLEAGAAFNKRKRQAMEGDPAIASALGLPAPLQPPAQTGSSVPAASSRTPSGAETFLRALSPGSASTQAPSVQAAGLRLSSAARPADLPGAPLPWARATGALFTRTFGSYIPADRLDPALFEKVRGLDDTAFADAYVKNGGDAEYVAITDAFTETNTDGSVKTIWVRQSADLSVAQPAAIQQFARACMHPAFKAGFPAGVRGGVVNFFTTQHPSVNAATWQWGISPGAQIASRIYNRLSDREDLYRAFFGGDGNAVRDVTTTGFDVTSELGRFPLTETDEYGRRLNSASGQGL